MTEKLKRINPITVAVILLVLGVCLTVFSGEKTKEHPTKNQSYFDESKYGETLENRLKTIIEEINGVGKVSVMITLEGSALYTYATDTSQDTKSDGDTKKESTIVLSANGSNSKEAVVSGYFLPSIKGVAVVCSETLTPGLQAKVIGVVSAALGISTGKIYVTN